MKKTFLAVCCLFGFSLAYSQDPAGIGLQGELSQMSKLGRSQTGFEGFQTYSAGTINGSQFYLPNWSSGSVTNIQKEVFKNVKYQFLFDKARQLLFIKVKDSTSVLLASNDQINAFTLTANDKTYYFEPGTNFDPAKKDLFYEVLVKDEKAYSLLKLVKTKLVKADPNDMIKIKAGENFDEFKDEITYYISYQNGIPQKVDLKEKSIKKTIPVSLSKKVQEYFDQNRDTHTDEGFLIGLIKYIN